MDVCSVKGSVIRLVSERRSLNDLIFALPPAPTDTDRFLATTRDVLDARGLTPPPEDQPARTEAFASEQRRATKAVLDCARQRGLKVLDTFDALAASNVPGGPRGLYGQWHMNDAGNEAVAGLIAAALDPPAH